MSMVSTTERICPNCGDPAIGNYCSQCGTKLADGASLGTVVADAIGKERLRFYQAIVGLIRAPVKTTISLTLNDGFKSYFSMLSAVVTAKAAAFFVTFPTILRDVFDQDTNPSAADAIEVTRYIARQYASLAVLFLISFFIYRGVSQIARPPGLFIKFVTIAAIVFGLIDIASAVLMYAGALTLGPSLSNNFDALYDAVDWSNRIATLMFFAAVSRRFWQISWTKALAAGIPLAVLNWKVIEPYVQTALERVTQ
jgi:hypothetical protein